MPYKKFIGKTVCVKGTLFHAFTGHHHTDVLMDVRSIKVDMERSLKKPKTMGTWRARTYLEA